MHVSHNRTESGDDPPALQAARVQLSRAPSGIDGLRPLYGANRVPWPE
jgi:hypothetical protein